MFERIAHAFKAMMQAFEWQVARQYDAPWGS